MSKDAKHFSDGMRWNRRDPERNSLWLLPSGPDQVGEASARAGSEAYIGDRGGECKPPSPSWGGTGPRSGPGWGKQAAAFSAG